MSTTSTWLTQPQIQNKSIASSIYTWNMAKTPVNIPAFTGVDTYQVITSKSICRPKQRWHEQTSTTFIGYLQLAPTDTLSEKALSVIGTSGLKRFETFKQFTQGWGNGQGRPLSTYSVAMTELFLNSFKDYLKVTPSIFLAYSGNLQLSWEDDFGGKIEIEFATNKIEYYIESKDNEGVIDLMNVNSIKSLEKIVA